MIQGYLDWFVTFVSSGISWMSGVYIVPGVSLLFFIISIALLCIVIGGLLIR